ncbi:MAG TPA: DNA repair protein RecO [Candidatus Saccharimonadales bacterium]
MTPIRTEAIVLRRTNYGEADRILQLLTPEHGKLSVIAKGVRREKSKLAGGVELLAVSDLVVQKGKGELGILTSARLRTFFVHILDDYTKLQLAYEILKKVNTASEMVPEPEWYYLAKEALAALDNPQIGADLVELWYRLQHSSLLGHGLNLKSDSNGQKLNSAERYVYDVQEMGLRVATGGDITANHIKLLRLLTANTPERVALVSGIAELLPAALRSLRQHDQG